MQQLSVRQTHEEVLASLVSKSLDQCKKLLQTELRYRSESKQKFIFLGESEQKFENSFEEFAAMNAADFMKLAKAFEAGNHIVMNTV